MKRLLLAAAVAGISVSAIAGGNMRSVNPFSGAYLGVGILGVQMSSNFVGSVGGTAVINERGGSYLGLGGQVHLGYQFAINHWAAGIEAFGGMFNDRTSFKESSATYNVGLNIKQKYDFGLDAQLGPVWHQTFIYFLIGPSWMRTDVSETGAATSELHSTEIGLKLGLGAEQALTQNIRLREQYSATSYADRKYNLLNVALPQIAYNSQWQQQFMIAVDYQFQV